MSSLDVMTILLSVAALLGTARLLGELARRIRQPAVLGEIVAGVLLGPTVMGRLAPGLATWLFPATGPEPIVLAGFSHVAIVLYMLVAGMEVDLSAVWRQGRPALLVSLGGMLVPFALGLGLGWFVPAAVGAQPHVPRLLFALFLAAALAISALPVIVRMLIDLNIFRSDLGMVVVAAAIVQDVTGWLVFSAVLGMMGAGRESTPVPTTIALVVVFAGAMLTVGRWLLNRVLPWLQAFASWPGGILGFTATLGMLSGALTEWIGVHAVFGSFLFGVAIGDSRHLRERTRVTLEQFVSFVFAPLFFASIGLRVDFLRGFDARLVVLVLTVALAGKVLGATLGARLGGIVGRQAWATGVALSSSGAMGIIFGLLALRAHIISERLFVALVVIALATSSLSGPVLQRLLKTTQRRRFVDHLTSKTFVPRLDSTDPAAVIGVLAEAAARASGIDRVELERAVLERERMMSTGLESGVATPHARIEGLVSPVVALGLCPRGADFDTVDGSACTIVALTLTPAETPNVQIELLADIARTLQDPRVRADVLAANSYPELLAALRTIDEAQHDKRTDAARPR